jgi:hypothetical protein
VKGSSIGADKLTAYEIDFRAKDALERLSFYPLMALVFRLQSLDLIDTSRWFWDYSAQKNL